MSKVNIKITPEWIAEEPEEPGAESFMSGHVVDIDLSIPLSMLKNSSKPSISVPFKLRDSKDKEFGPVFNLKLPREDEVQAPRR
jgi:hypothetical protein